MVKEKIVLPLGTILHPTDFSKPSEFAFRVASSLARDYNARLILLHVIPPPMMMYAGEMVPAEGWPSTEEAKEKLRRMEGDTHHVRVESTVLEGDAVDAILRAAKETHSDAIVMGTHGRRALNRLLMGSVAEQIVRKATCPVLTVRSPVQTLLKQPSAVEETVST